MSSADPLLHWRRAIAAAFSGLLAGILFGACRLSDKNAPSSGSMDQKIAGIHARQDRVYPAAFLFKPEQTHETSLCYELAPLILQELDPQSAGSPSGQFTNAQIVLARRKPEVFCGASSVRLGGKVHIQITYVWLYDSAERTSTIESRDAHGIRITLDSDGRPVIWEVLSDSSRVHLIYVAESLEGKAHEVYGPPLDGRRFSIEARGDEDDPFTVARLISDGPVPMGPILYIPPHTLDITTLICRCMPSQVGEIVGSDYYQLRSLDALPDSSYLPALRQDPAAQLKRCLRLPTSF